MSDRHKYEYEVDLLTDSAAAHVVRLVGKGKRVLEVGAGPGSIARLLKGHGGCQVTAIERDPSAIKRLSEICERIYQIDLNADDWTAAIRPQKLSRLSRGFRMRCATTARAGGRSAG